MTSAPDTTVPSTAAAGAEVCREKAGFLFSHACKFPPVNACSRCQRIVCQQHTCMGKGGMTCVSCNKKNNRRGRDKTNTNDNDRHHHHGNNPYFYGGYYYHGYGYYGEGYWGSDAYDNYTPDDYNDFTEADGAFLVAGDENFEQDMGGS